MKCDPWKRGIEKGTNNMSGGKLTFNVVDKGSIEKGRVVGDKRVRSRVMWPWCVRVVF